MPRKLLISITFLTLLSAMVYSCQNGSELKQQIYYTNGRDLYIKHCQNCHGTSGEGLGKLAPPLTDTTFLKANRNRLACLIRNGSDTTMVIHNESYEGKMPGNRTLANIDIVQLIVYITNANGNKQGIYTQEQVAEDLQECR